MVQEAPVIDPLRGSLPGLWRPEFEPFQATLAQAPATGPETPARASDSFVLLQLELFDSINLAAAIVNRDERIVRLNRRCERVLGPSLMLQRERFVARHRRCNDRLRKAIQAVFSDHGGPRPEAVQGVIMRDSEPPILFRALPLGASCSDTTPSHALLVFSVPRSQARPDAELLSRAFGLTPAQARIARHLSTGVSLEIVAARLGLKKETVRNHLKQIFLRTGTCRQGELVALLSAFWLGAQEEGKEAA